MATVKHTNWLNLMLGGGNHTLPDLDADDIDVSLLDQTDSGTVDATDEDYADVNAGVVVATAETTFAATAGGVATLTGAVTFTAVTGDSAEYLTSFKNTGTASTSPLIITWDSASTGLPVTPNGGNITATWGSNIFVTLA